MFKTSICGISIQFTIPEWFPPNRLDYSKAHRYPEGHAWAGSYDHSTYHNSAEDNLYKKFDWKEFYPNSHIIIEFDGDPKDLLEWIEYTTNKLNQFFKQYKEGKE